MPKDFFQLGVGVFGAADNNQALVAVEGGDNAQVVVGFDYLGQLSMFSGLTVTVISDFMFFSCLPRSGTRDLSPRPTCV